MQNAVFASFKCFTYYTVSPVVICLNVFCNLLFQCTIFNLTTMFCTQNFFGKHSENQKKTSFMNQLSGYFFNRKTNFDPNTSNTSAKSSLIFQTVPFMYTHTRQFQTFFGSEVLLFKIIVVQMNK